MEMKLFENENLATENSNSKYTKKVETPIYKPRGEKPHILELMDCERTKRLVNEIEKLGGGTFGAREAFSHRSRTSFCGIQLFKNSRLLCTFKQGDASDNGKTRISNRGF